MLNNVDASVLKILSFVMQLNSSSFLLTNEIMPSCTHKSVKFNASMY